MEIIKVPAVMVAAVKAVRPADRSAAKALAEVTFTKFFNKLTAFGDFDRQTNISMAADAAAAEVSYMFA